MKKKILLFTGSALALACVAVGAFLLGAVVRAGGFVMQSTAENRLESQKGEAYTFFAQANTALADKWVGSVDGNRKDALYTVRGYAPETWLLRVNKGEMNFIGYLYLRDGVTDVPAAFRKLQTETTTIWLDIYETTLISYLSSEAANMDFIAIDLSTLQNATAADKVEIVKFIEENYCPVKDADLDKLEAQGLFDRKELYIKNGILLSIDDVETQSKKIVIHGGYYMSGKGAAGYETTWKPNKSGGWQLNDIRMIWIS
jgi:hypothetical protein